MLTAVGVTPDPGFFSLATYRGYLFAGTYGEPKVYIHDGASLWLQVPGIGSAGESVFDMREYSIDNLLYATTESTGKVFRLNLATQRWDVVFQANLAHGWNNACSHLEHRGSIPLTIGGPSCS